jgi:hypothetical protein
LQTYLGSLLLSVEDEGAKLTGVQVITNEQQEPFVELEGAWELVEELMYTVQELDEDGSAIGVLIIEHLQRVSTSERIYISTTTTTITTPAENDRTWCPKRTWNLCPKLTQSFSINISNPFRVL